jgi:hypothetical protein
VCDGGVKRLVTKLLHCQDSANQELFKGQNDLAMFCEKNGAIHTVPHASAVCDGSVKRLVTKLLHCQDVGFPKSSSY